MKKLLFLSAIVAAFMLHSCTENYSNGERVGYITKFSQKGLIWKSWEGELNLTQTGMNTSSTFAFSVDNDNEPAGLVDTLNAALNNGWKIGLTYHEVAGYNWFDNRGDTDYFVTGCTVLDRGETTQ